MEKIVTKISPVPPIPARLRLPPMPSIIRKRCDVTISGSSSQLLQQTLQQRSDWEYAGVYADEARQEQTLARNFSV